MLGKIIGAVAGKRIADQFGGISGTGGALIGAAVPVLLRRAGPAGLVAAAVAGYAFKRHREKKEAEASRPARRAD